MEKFLVFCDESGTASKKDGVSHFIYCAVIIRENDYEYSLKLLKEISDNFLFGHKISSKNRAISKNIKKRLDILKHICDNLDCKVYSLIVDKAALESQGLQIRDVFYKYFQKLLTGGLHERLTNFSIYLDSSGSDEFQTSLRNYILKIFPDFQANLFSQENKYFLMSDDQQPLIQFADLFSNSLLKIYSASHRHTQWQEIYDTIESKIFKPQFFPYNSVLSTEDVTSGMQYKVNKEIYKNILNSVERLNYSDKIEKTILEYLVYYSRIIPEKLVETHDISAYVQNVLEFPIKVEKVREYVRNLRYKGILIVSKAGKSGYKIAVNEEDISSYFQHYLSYIIPMLEKANIADENLKLALDTKSYFKISKFLKALKEPDLM